VISLDTGLPGEGSRQRKSQAGLSVQHNFSFLPEIKINQAQDDIKDDKGKDADKQVLFPVGVPEGAEDDAGYESDDVQFVGSMGAGGGGVVARTPGHEKVDQHIGKSGYAHGHREKVEEERDFPGVEYHEKAYNCTDSSGSSNHRFIGRVKEPCRKQAHGPTCKKSENQSSRPYDALQRIAKKQQEEHIAQQVAQAAMNEKGGKWRPPFVPEHQVIITVFK